MGSRRALELALVLDQRPDGARLAELAAAAAMPLSAAQSAVRLLLAEGAVEATKGPRPRYRLREEHPAHAAFLSFAARSLSIERACELVLRGSPAVEFAARDAQGHLVVRSALAEPVHVVALERGLERIRGGREDRLPMTSYEHDLLRELLPDDPRPRERALGARLIKGSIPRSFPAARARRARRGHPLGRAHGAVPRVSRRAVRALAREHGLRRIALFGSAVRSDFRPDSDIDVLIEPRPKARLTLLDLAAIQERLERLFDRDVDLLTPGGLRPEMRERIAREAIPLHG